MNKLKTIGISALAGSLVAFSAQAAEWSVAGGTEITMTHLDADEVTGNPFGSSSNITFTASGDLTDSIGITVAHAMGDTHAFGSSKYTFDLGSLGTVTFNQGTTDGAASIDNVMPTAYEEADAGMSTGMIDIGSAAAGSYFGYKKTMEGDMGLVIGGAFSPGSDGGTTGDGGAGGGVGASAFDVYATATPADGLGIGFGIGSISNADGADQDEKTMHITYAMGPVTVGLMSASDETDGGTKHNSRGFGVSASVTDDLSISYQSLETEYDATTGADITAKFEGISAAYSMGNVSVKYFRNEGENIGGTASSDDAQSELALSFSF